MPGPKIQHQSGVRPPISRQRESSQIRQALLGEQKEQIRLSRIMAFGRRILTEINKEGINYPSPIDLAHKLFPEIFAPNTPEAAETKNLIETICRYINYKTIHNHKQYWKLDLFDLFLALDFNDLTGKTIYSCRNLNFSGLTLNQVKLKGSVGYCLFNNVNLYRLDISQATELGSLLEPYREKLIANKAPQHQRESTAGIISSLRQSHENEEPNMEPSAGKIHSDKESVSSGQNSPGSGNMPSNPPSPDPRSTQTCHF